MENVLEQPLANYLGNPQVEDGHTKIANELLDAIICHDFTKRQLVIILFIMRKTYGWNKTEDDIARSQIVESTGLNSPHITTAIQELQEMNVIIVSNGSHAKRYKLNKLYDTWRVTKRVIITDSVTITKTVTITETVTDNYQNGNNKLPKQYPQKTTTKDNTKDMCCLVLEHLNMKAQRNYQPVKANLNLIQCRLKEFTFEDCIRVIDIKTSQWINDKKMNAYLRPSTLFNATNFAQYAAEKEIKKQNGLVL